jgi:3alpha(or 20beta)-hydroxysteroid dehydrogenase
MSRFQGKVVLVSGGARGMGAAEARMLVAEGAKVVIGDVLEDEGRRLAAELGGASVFVRQDVTEQADWDRAVAAAVALGGLHGLVNNAGIYKPGTLMETDAAMFERHLRVNQFGCFLGMKAVVGAMERSGGGSIVNISSIAGLVGSVYGSSAYSATKGAVRLFTKSTAIQHAREGIRCNSIHPGPLLDTEMMREAFADPAMREERRRRIPLGRIGTAEDVAYGVLYLASEEASWVTGAELVIDGGITAQ